MWFCYFHSGVTRWRVTCLAYGHSGHTQVM